ncbi:MAG: adenosine kinase [Prevotellaceae bacterium]|jgi:sugar/nucleoside kinase (ribokinase family)|nr:adenosine kinase [Prevotellaceae bacterium]
MKKILGIGNALTDILLQIEGDHILEELNLPKGSMQLVCKERSSEISRRLQHLEQKMIAGGSASNAIVGISRLGGETGFIGKTGQDEIGSFYIDDLNGNDVRPQILQSSLPSGRCVVLISPDGERTMCTYLGAASELLPEDLQPSFFAGYDIFHIEGYLVQNHALIHRAVELAKQAGLKISIDLASYNIVEENLDFLHGIVENYVDIVLANEEEAYAFTSKMPEEALHQLAQKADIAVVKVGKNGSYVKSNGEKHDIAAITAQRIDTTGAGDLYASGFLYAYAKGLPLEICGKIASLVSGKSVEIIGAKIPNKVWDDIFREIELIQSL